MTTFRKSDFGDWGNGSLDSLDELVVMGSCEERFFELSEREREQIVKRAIEQHGSSSDGFGSIDKEFENSVSDQKDNFVFDTQEGIWQGYTDDRDNDGTVEKVAIATFSPY